MSLAAGWFSGTCCISGEINSSQELAWRRWIKVLEDGESAPRTYDRASVRQGAAYLVHVRIPTTDARELLLTRFTQPRPELELLLEPG